MIAVSASTNGDASHVDHFTNGTDSTNGHSSIPSEDDDSPQDANKMPSMFINDHEFSQSTLKGLSKLRKNRQFCDVILQVERRECVVERACFANLFWRGSVCLGRQDGNSGSPSDPGLLFALPV